MKQDLTNPNVFVTPDYLLVLPLGYGPDAKDGGGNGSNNDSSEGGSGSGGSGTGNTEFNPFDHLTKLEQIIEEWINREYTFDGVDLKNKLKDIIKDIKETKSELVSVNGKIQAIVTNQDIAITTDDEALAQAIQRINAKFGEIASSIDTLRQSYASSDAAIAQKFEQLRASIPNASGIATEITKNVETKINQAVDGKVTTLTGDLTRLRTKVDGQDVTITDAKAIATQAKEYAARVKSVATVGNKITGWQYADGTGKTSTFEIMADAFRISNSHRSFVPFEIVGNQIRLGANVVFSEEYQKGTVTQIDVGRLSVNQYQKINPHQLARTLRGNEASVLICIECFADTGKTIYSNGTYVTDYASAASLRALPAKLECAGGGVYTCFYFKKTS